jgi:hypothetical protein
MGSTHFEVESSKAPEVLLWGFVELHALRDLIAQVRCAADSNDIASVSIYDVRRSIDIKMYRLPAADSAFNDDLKLFGQSPKSWPLPDGRPFDQSLLAPQGVPPGWKHRAIQTVDGRPRIVHAFRGGGRGMIVRHLVDQAVLDHPMFHWFAKKVVVIDKAWKLDPPKFHQSPAAFDDEIGPMEEALSAQELDQLADNAMKAWEILQLNEQSTRKQVISAIHDAIEEMRPNFSTYKPNVQHNITVCFGALWGQMLCGAAGWDWIGLSVDGDEAFLALTSPDRAHAIAPVNLMQRNLLSKEQDDAPPENTVRLVFNMIEAGQLPPSRAGAFLMLR